MSEHRIARLDELPDQRGKEFTVAGRVLAVFRDGGEVHVIDGICPHAGGPLAKGYVWEGVVTCPWHGWQFSIATGQHCLTPQICQERFPVRVDDGEVVVGLPDE